MHGIFRRVNLHGFDGIYTPFTKNYFCDYFVSRSVNIELNGYRFGSDDIFEICKIVLLKES